METYVTKKEFDAIMATLATKSEVKEAVKDLEMKMMRRFDDLTGRFEEFRAEITGKFEVFTKEITDKFNKLEAKVDDKFAQIDDKFNQIMKKLSGKKNILAGIRCGTGASLASGLLLRPLDSKNLIIDHLDMSTPSCAHQ